MIDSRTSLHARIILTGLDRHTNMRREPADYINTYSMKVVTCLQYHQAELLADVIIPCTFTWNAPDEGPLPCNSVNPASVDWTKINGVLIHHFSNHLLENPDIRNLSSPNVLPWSLEINRRILESNSYFAYVKRMMLQIPDFSGYIFIEANINGFFQGKTQDDATTFFRENVKKMAHSFLYFTNILRQTHASIVVFGHCNSLFRSDNAIEEMCLTKSFNALIMLGCAQLNLGYLDNARMGVHIVSNRHSINITQENFLLVGLNKFELQPIFDGLGNLNRHGIGCFNVLLADFMTCKTMMDMAIEY